MNENQQISNSEDEFSSLRELLDHESCHVASSTTVTKKMYQYQAPPQHIRDYRFKILVWVINVVDHLRFDREVAIITMDCLDRFLLLHTSQENIIIRTQTYQLVAMSCLYLAMKLRLDKDNSNDVEGIKPKRIVSLQKYSELSSGHFSPEDIASMELSISSTLKGKVRPVSSMCFVDHFLRLMRSVMKQDKYLSGISTFQSESDMYLRMTLGREVLHKLAIYFAELAILMPENSPYFNLDDCQQENGFSLYRESFTQSIIAYVSILLSMEAISDSILPPNIREKFLRECLQLGRTTTSTTNEQNDMNLTLNPDRKDVNELKARIKGRFRPHIFLKHFTTTTEGRQDDNNCHTIAIEQSGILKPEFLEEINLSCSTVVSPMSSISSVSETSSVSLK